jgi:hypothetical protein
MEEKVMLTQEELTSIQQMNTEFSKAKMAIGDLELQKEKVMEHIKELKAEFALNEKALIQKYGEDSVINVQTGEVTKK